MNRPTEPSFSATCTTAAALAEVTLAVLAGGEGSRMGRPKGCLRVDGQPILRHLLRDLSWPGPTLLVTAPGREHPPAWEDFEREVTDPIAGEGPVRGILTAFEAAQTELVVIATVDMPGVGRQQLAWIVQQLFERPTCPGVVISRSTPDGARTEPFPAAFRRSVRKRVQRQLSAGERRVHGLLSQLGMTTLSAPDWPEATWTNLNHPSDLLAYLSNRSNNNEVKHEHS